LIELKLRPTRHKTGHFRDVLPSKSLGLVLKNENQHKKVNMHPKQNILQHKINTKTKSRFGLLLQPPAWKRNGSILEGVDR